MKVARIPNGCHHYKGLYVARHDPLVNLVAQDLGKINQGHDCVCVCVCVCPYVCLHQEYIRETIDEWKRCDLDVLLCPVIGPAFNHNYSGKLSSTRSSSIDLCHLSPNTLSKCKRVKKKYICS